MLRHPYDTPTFKTNALRLVSNEGWLKRLFQLYSIKLSIIDTFITRPERSIALAKFLYQNMRLSRLCLHT